MDNSSVITIAGGGLNFALKKAQTGIPGFDEITAGGLPLHRPTLVCGSAGSGKTLFALEFLVNGILKFDEPGVFVSFEENETELIENVASLGWDLKGLTEQGKLFIDHVHIERSEIEETGEFNLEGLFIRIEAAARAVGARRIGIDSIEALFSGFSSDSLLRAEIRRLFRWLKEKNLTAVITGEKGNQMLTRHGLEEYISDCVLFLDNRMQGQVATRRMRIIKYRGTSHGTNEYPFLLTERGFSVVPITALAMDYEVSTQRVSTGIERLDTMLGGSGYYRGSSVLISGTAGTGKSSLGACFVSAACGRGEQAIYFSFEEAPKQIIRNMGSIGIDLQTPVDQGLLTFHSVRVTSFGLEMHLAGMLRMIDEIKPAVVVIDPISNLSSVAVLEDVKEMLARIIDYMKMLGITAVFTDLSHTGSSLEATEAGISSLMDTWILLRDIELNGERNRGMYVLKSRGMSHSNQIREFIISREGISLKDVYIGPGGVLTGTARVVQEAAEAEEQILRQRKANNMRQELKRREKALQMRIQELQDAFTAEKEEIEQELAETQAKEKNLAYNTSALAAMRGQDKEER
jgi:circadian clock protein KaiC